MTVGHGVKERETERDTERESIVLPMIPRIKKRAKLEECSSSAEPISGN